MKDVKKLFIDFFPECQAAFEAARDLREIRVVCMTRQLVMGGTAVAGPSPKLFSVFLDDCGPNKIGVIKEIRNLTNLGLREAKDLADIATPYAGNDEEKPVGKPVRVLASIPDQRARDVATQLRGAGAKVRVEAEALQR